MKRKFIQIPKSAAYPPIHTSTNGIRYIRISEIPFPSMREEFENFIKESTRPLIIENNAIVADAVFIRDFEIFIGRRHWD